MRRDCFVLGLFVSAACHAQCTPTYHGELGLPGLGDGYADPMIAWNDGRGESLYVGGSFSEIGGAFINLLAKYNASNDTWSALGSGLSTGFTNGFLASMVPCRLGSSTGAERLIVAGRFTSAGGVPGTEAIAAWTGQRWEAMGLTVPAGNAIWDTVVGDIGQGPRLFVAGGFGIPFGGIAQFDGQTWSAVGTGVGIAGAFSPYIADLEIFNDGSGPALYAVGRFDTIDGVATQLAAKFRNGQWSRIGLGISRLGDALKYLDAMTTYDDGTGPALYVGGTQFGINTVAGSTNVAKWNGSAWTKSGQVLGTGRVSALRGWNDGSGPALYFAGTAFPGINNFGKLVAGQWVSVDGSLRDSSTPNSATSGNWPSAFGLAEAGGNLLIGGSFITIGPVPARGLATLQACCPCPADFNRDGSVDGSDVESFFVAWQATDSSGDTDCSGGVDGSDVEAFFRAWEAGGCV
ncbi:MAG: hypothetical protein JSR77_14315 [Planctomycetes bacterium]|nr:hypothetical protein [Planctomycetota bacterium]